MLERLTLGVCTIAVLFFFSAAAYAQETRRVVGNTIVSDKLPAIKVQVDKAFKYLGKFDFVIGAIAKGERFVFVEATRKKRIKRLFIAQFEQILPTSQEIYRYNFDKAILLGEHRFRHNTFAFSGAEAKRENPKGEASLTADFLAAKGFRLEDELMSSRFLTVPDQAKKNEMILFYIENISKTGRRLADLYVGDEETVVWKAITSGLKDRSSAAFKIK